jgi:pre-60S factor REI1
MLETTTATTATTTTMLPLTSLSSSPEADSTLGVHKETAECLEEEQFTPGQCLFCSSSSTSFADSVVHMQKSHGLFVPHRQKLAVDLETFFRYLHIVIFGYRECIHCGTERGSIRAIQQHMTNKGHCKFDASDEDSEFAQFYDFSEPDSDVELEEDGDDEDYQEEITTRTYQRPLRVDEDSIRLPSGKLISRHSAANEGLSLHQIRRRRRIAARKPEKPLLDAGVETEAGQEEARPDSGDKQSLSKREKREKAALTYRMTNMSANDRRALAHLPASQQRSLLATQLKHEEKVQKEESRRRGKVDRKGNKNLYAYWNTETPVYLCG